MANTYVTGSVTSGVGWVLNKIGSICILNFMNMGIPISGYNMIPSNCTPSRLSQVVGTGWDSTSNQIVIIIITQNGSVICANPSDGGLIGVTTLRGNVVWSVA